mmetsp:Transcript_40466/g.114608  ORF Transcript_40466/g.114608 Transcript_40466/m.114608 type:complete len:341 (-) Transcript_40466:56-1078(-)
MGDSVTVPVVDFSAFSAAVIPPDGKPFEATPEQVKIAAQLKEVLTTHGFVYAAGLISASDVAEAFSASRQLFDESVDRSRLHQISPETNTGYGGIGKESLNARRAPDMKEVFNVRKAHLDPGSTLWTGSPAGFRSSATKAWENCSNAAIRALLGFGVALELKDPATFARRLHSWDLSTLRFLHYPGTCPSNGSLKSGKSDVGQHEAVPCGEHTDFGAVTVLLLEDSAPGLQARRPGGGWMDAPGMAGTVLLNTGAMLSRWCNDYVKATPHRVLITPAERYSIAFFCDPDSDQVIDCLPEFVEAANRPKYPPITAGDYLQQCLNGTMLGQVSDEAKNSLVV